MGGLITPGDDNEPLGKKQIPRRTRVSTRFSKCERERGVELWFVFFCRGEGRMNRIIFWQRVGKASRSSSWTWEWVFNQSWGLKGPLQRNWREEFPSRQILRVYKRRARDSWSCVPQRERMESSVQRSGRRLESPGNYWGNLPRSSSEENPTVRPIRKRGEGRIGSGTGEEGFWFSHNIHQIGSFFRSDHPPTLNFERHSIPWTNFSNVNCTNILPTYEYQNFLYEKKERKKIILSFLSSPRFS